MTFKCIDKCGKCCCIQAMSSALVDKNKDKFQVEPKSIESFGITKVVVTDDGMCVFLNRETKMCSIYEERPDVCREFGLSRIRMLQCPYLKPNGIPRTEKETRKHEEFVAKEREKASQFMKDWS